LISWLHLAKREPVANKRCSPLPVLRHDDSWNKQSIWTSDLKLYNHNGGKLPNWDLHNLGVNGYIC
jgi:hypothetical protein